MLGECARQWLSWWVKMCHSLISYLKYHKVSIVNIYAYWEVMILLLILQECNNYTSSSQFHMAFSTVILSWGLYGESAIVCYKLFLIYCFLVLPEFFSSYMIMFLISYKTLLPFFNCDHMIPQEDFMGIVGYWLVNNIVFLHSLITSQLYFFLNMIEKFTSIPPQKKRVQWDITT